MKKIVILENLAVTSSGYVITACDVKISFPKL